MSKRPFEELAAGNNYRNSMIEKADGVAPSGAVMWHGWALMDAFLAGVDYARSATPPPPSENVGKLVEAVLSEIADQLGGVVVVNGIRFDEGGLILDKEKIVRTALSAFQDTTKSEAGI